MDCLNAIAFELVSFFQFNMFITAALVAVLLQTRFQFVIYGLIAWKIILNNKQQTRLGESHVQGHRNKVQGLVVINSGIIVACFILCASPWMILTTLRLLKGLKVKRDEISYSVTYFIVVINSLLDPLIYFLVSYYRKRKRI